MLAEEIFQETVKIFSTAEQVGHWLGIEFGG
jgi:hypothetical protein